MKMILSLFAMVFGVFAVPGLKSTSYAQMTAADINCVDQINWTTSVKGNRGQMPVYRPSSNLGNVWTCQAKPTNAPDQKFWENSFYDVSSAVAFDHAEYRCEREYGNKSCIVRCTYVPYLCIPLNPN
jgi:hypothetical protein